MRPLFPALLLGLPLVACGEEAPQGSQEVGRTAKQPHTLPPIGPGVGDQQRGTPGDDAQPGAAGGPRPPEILVEGLLQDFGVVSDVHHLEHTFAFMNTGDEPLHITDVHAACGCTATELARTEIEGGGVAYVGVVWDLIGHGQQSKTITLSTNDPTRPSVVLTVVADIRPFVTFDPPSIELGVAQNTLPQVREIELICEDPNFQITDFVLPMGLEVRVIEPPHNGRAKLEVSLAPMPRRGLFVPKVGVNITALHAGQPVEHTAQFAFRANLYRELATDPALLSAGRLAPGASVAVETLLTRPGGGAFEITGARIASATGEGLNVEVVPWEGGYRIQVRGVPRQAPGNLRARVVLETNLPEEPIVTLDVMGMVQ